MSQPDDDRVEREIRAALRQLDPGPAPHSLRQRTLAVPLVEGRSRATWATSLPTLLAAAAVVVLAVVALGIANRHAPGPSPSNGIGVASSASAAIGPSAFASTPARTAGPSDSPASPTATPFPTVQPSTQVAAATPFPVQTTQAGAGPAFDPTRDGAGVRQQVDSGDGERVLIALAAAALAAAALGLRRWRRVVPAVGALGLAVWVIAASLMPVNFSSSGFGWGLYTYGATAPTGFENGVTYEVAPPGQHFSFSVGDLHATSPLPVTLDAVEAPNLDPQHFIGPAVTAAWLDREASGNGGSSGPVEPLTTIDLSGYRSIWIVARAGACAPGPGFDPQLAAEGKIGATILDRITVQISVLGIPRRVELPLLTRIVEPGNGCAGPTTAPWVTPSPGS